MTMELKKLSQNTSITATLSRWIAWTLLVLAGVVSSENVNLPEISPNKDFIFMKVGETLELGCRGNAPVTWNFTQNYENEHSRLTLTHGEESTGQKKYWSNFTLTHLTVSNVGYYTCQYNSSMDYLYDDSSDEPKSQHVYVYVEDSHNILVNSEPSFQVLDATQGQQFRIPCKPTSESVHIELSKDHSPIELTSSAYDKRDGFKIETVVRMSAGDYQCTGHLGNEIQTINYHLVVSSTGQFLNKPKITPSGVAVSVGATFTLDCIVEHDLQMYYTLNWTEPAQVIDSGRATIINEWLPGKPPNNKKAPYRSRLIVKNASKEDAGEYECTVKGSGNSRKSAVSTIRVYEEEERFLNVTTLAEEIKVMKLHTAKWVINISSYPPNPVYSWIDGKDGKEIIPDSSHFVEDRGSEVVLQKLSVKLEDAGPYQFVVDIPKFPELKKVLNLSLVVTSIPDVYISPPPKYFMANQTYQLMCEADGFPIPSIQWYFQPCPNFKNDFQDCSPLKPITVDKMSPLIPGHQKSIRNVTFTANEHGIYSCYAGNSLKKDVADMIYIRVVDFPGQVGYGIDAPKRFIEGDTANITCGASKLNFANKIYWQGKNKSDSTWFNLTSNPPNFVINEIETTWSWKKSIQIERIVTEDSGEYRCVVDNDTIFEDLLIKVERTKAPIIVSTNLNDSTTTIKEGDVSQFKLYCRADGVPEPTISWFRNGEPLAEKPPEMTYTLSKDNTTVTFDYIREAATGEYTCASQNRAGRDEKRMIVEVLGPSNKLHPAMIVFLVFIVILLFALMACLAKKMHKERRMKVELRQLYRVEFEEGAVGDINPDLGVEDQASLLPYDKKWEFPKDRIKLGMQLGSGAFGRVIKAEATGILKNESVTEVAVKMVKANADESHIKALMSELKIMVHLGQHVNVVNLLGACTKNLAKKRELLVIVEYCKFGSLLSYLHRHKHSFINQLDPVRDVVDSNMFCHSHDDPGMRQSQVPKLNYASLTFTDTGNRKPTANGYRTLEEIGSGPVTPSTPPPAYAPPSSDYNPNHSLNGFSEGYGTGDHIHSVCTDMSFVSTCPSVVDTDGKRRSSSGSSCVGHYRGDYQPREVEELTTSTLLGWSFQIARGMEYLASRKVLHGDLAARNVLLAEDNVVKICDFGLAKEMYKDYKYKKKSEGVLLPVKWMAIESIYFAEFSTQSDAWSFGVVLWEIFTLGKTPYPGMEADDRFYKMLNDGYRMEKPPLAPSSIYDLMMSCWSHDPSSRPTFTALQDRIGDLMEESLRQHYIDLNVTFDQSNKLRLQSNPDYLAKMGGPEFRVPEEEPMYANVPPTDNSQSQTSQQQNPNTLYQNVQVDLESGEESKRLQPLAENAGYMFVNHSNSPDEERPMSSIFSKAGMANNDGYCLANFPPSSPGPTDLFSPRPLNPKADFEFNFADGNTERDGEDEKKFSSPCKIIPNHQTPTISPTKEISGISNLNYIPNNTIFPQDMKEFNDVLLDINEKRPSPKRQKNDSGVSSIGSNFENKSPTPPICENNDSNCNSEVMQNRNSYISSHENKHQGIDVS